MKILVIGNGKMGCCLKENYSNEIVDYLFTQEQINSFDEDIDGIIDFSHHSLIKDVLFLAKRKKVPLVIGTTSLSEEDYFLINETKEIPICIDENYSLGILNLKKCIDSLKSFQFDKIVINETHHIHKLDSPSGTALSLKKYLSKYFINKIEINSFRKGDIFGIHQIDFIMQGEVISLRHEAFSRDIFASGAYLALKKLINKEKRVYHFEEIING